MGGRFLVGLSMGVVSGLGVDGGAFSEMEGHMVLLSSPGGLWPQVTTNTSLLTILRYELLGTKYQAEGGSSQITIARSLKAAYRGLVQNSRSKGISN